MKFFAVFMITLVALTFFGVVLTLSKKKGSCGCGGGGSCQSGEACEK